MLCSEYDNLVTLNCEMCEGGKMEAQLYIRTLLKTDPLIFRTGKDP